jgi:hypothetical protein
MVPDRVDIFPGKFRISHGKGTGSIFCPQRKILQKYLTPRVVRERYEKAKLEQDKINDKE